MKKPTFIVKTHNRILIDVLEKINSMDEVLYFLEASNTNLVRRLRYNDHGITHARIVCSNALLIRELLSKRGIIMSIVDHGVSEELADVVLFLSSIFHDSGNPIHRGFHERLGLFWVKELMEKALVNLDTKERIAVLSDALHACVAHECVDVLLPLTVEAGIIAISDALDMEKGRARIPNKLGKKDIHSFSALAIEKVKIEEGKRVPINIYIEMNDTAGIFQVSELLKHRINGSGLKEYFHVKAEIIKARTKEIIELEP
jgi:metal-dependent HD superfamily phosphatase/phosphodiesterase